jgi:hypothetical protein
MSEQVTPSPVNPAWQAHVLDPVVFMQAAVELHPPLFVRHSLMSAQVRPSPA